MVLLCVLHGIIHLVFLQSALLLCIEAGNHFQKACNIILVSLKSLQFVFFVAWLLVFLEIYFLYLLTCCDLRITFLSFVFLSLCSISAWPLVIVI
jgi:hypothetical protein